MAPDCHVKSGKALYSVPWRLIGQQVTVRTAGDVVQIFHNDTVVATHVLHLSGRSTNFEHYPPHKIAHTLRTRELVPHPGRTDRARRGRDRRRTLAGQRHPPAARHPRDHPAARNLRRCPPGRRVRPRPGRRGSRLRTVKGILVAGTEHGDDPPRHAPATPPAMLRGPDAFDTEHTA